MSSAARKSWIVLAAGTTVVLAAAALVRSNSSSGVDDSFTGTFEQEIVRVTPLTGGLIAEVRVHEGDHVEQGDVLLRLDDSAVRARYDQARSLADRAAAQLNAASFLGNLSPEAVAQLLDRAPEVQAAERAYVRAVAEADRAPSDAEARRKLNEAAAGRDEARAKISRPGRAAFPPGSDLSSQIQQQLRQMQDQLGSATVTAPCAGTVEILRLQKGDPAFPGQPVAAIARSGSFYVDVYATAEQRAHIEEGRPARVQIGSAGSMDGKIQHVSRTPVDFGLTPNEDARQLFQVHVAIDNPAAALRPGMSARVWLERVN